VEKEGDPQHSQVVYGVRDTRDESLGTGKVLEISGDAEVRKNLIGGRFPKGAYI